MARKCRLFFLFMILLLSSVTSQLSDQQPQSISFPPADLLCISDCESCPVICSPPPSPPSSPPPQATPKPPTPPPPPPPSPVHHHSPPPPYYFDTPSPAAHPPPPPPSYISWGGGGSVPSPPPSIYVYNPGTTTPPVIGQRNVSDYPYYYFYTSKAASCYVTLRHQGIILLLVSFIVLPIFFMN